MVENRGLPPAGGILLLAGGTWVGGKAITAGVEAGEALGNMLASAGLLTQATGIAIGDLAGFGIPVAAGVGVAGAVINKTMQMQAVDREARHGYSPKNFVQTMRNGMGSEDRIRDFMTDYQHLKTDKDSNFAIHSRASGIWYVREKGANKYQEMDSTEYNEFKDKVAKENGTLNVLDGKAMSPLSHSDPSALVITRYVGGKINGDTPDRPGMHILGQFTDKKMLFRDGEDITAAYNTVYGEHDGASKIRI